ncbi:helix-turn-helix domain-containing protein [Nonomuraea angiospora]|uniref:helix-turn-helix domain-containing protein n=1 Tax=Nonomuraea angiospora TaxID=46172 RepID=UPI00344C5C2B
MAASTSRNQMTPSHTPATLTLETEQKSVVGGDANEDSKSGPAKAQRKNRRKGSTWLTIDDICDELGIHRRTWQHWRTRNLTPEMHRLPNGEYRIHRDAYQDWLTGLKVTA